MDCICLCKVVKFSLLITRHHFRFRHAACAPFTSHIIGCKNVDNWRSRCYDSTILRGIHVSRSALDDSTEPKQNRAIDSIGNCTPTNAQEQLNHFKQVHDIRNDYTYGATGPDHDKLFTAKLEMFFSKIDKKITAKGEGRTKLLARRECALAMVSELYKFGLIAPSGRTLQLQSKKWVEPNSYPVAISPEMVSRLEDCLHQLDLPTKGSKDATKFDEQETCDQEPNEADSFGVSWSMPDPHWNTWTNRKIENPSYDLDELSKRMQAAHKVNTIDEHIAKLRVNLPIFKHREEILNLMRENQVIVVNGGTGSGKSTQIPQYILEECTMSGSGPHCNILVTQPRRLSAASIANRIANERNERLGISVGYEVRFKRQLPRPFGSMLFCTTGMALRKLERGLKGVTHIILDEVHDRSIDTDFALSLVRYLIALNPQLRVVLMSATLDTSLFAEYFGGCPIVNVEGRMYPVEHHFINDGESDPREINYQLIVGLLEHIAAAGDAGDVLIFLPGWKEILSMSRLLSECSEFSEDKYLILRCHSQVPLSDQELIFRPAPPGTRKIVLSSNIAESSITIDNIVYVIDSCRSRTKIYNPSTNMAVYDTMWASQSNAQQRRGRAGRVQPGVCYTLCSKEKFNELDMFPVPEIHRVPIHSLVLKSKLFGINDFLDNMIEPPLRSAVVKAEILLEDIGALHFGNGITPLGRLLAKLPLEPRLGKMQILGHIFGVGDLTSSMVSQTDRDVFITEMGNRRLTYEQKEFSVDRYSDHVAKVVILDKWRSLQPHETEDFCNAKGLNFPMVDILYKTKQQICNLLLQAGFPEESMEWISVDANKSLAQLDLATALLCVGLYPNICRHLKKREVLTQQLGKAKVHSSSVNCCNDLSTFPYPFFVFDEKIHVGVANCKSLTMISPIHVVLFGSRNATVVDESTVRIDGWLKFKMDPHHFYLIRSVRQAIEMLITNSAQNPEQLLNLSPEMKTLVEVVRDICKMDAGDYNIDRSDY